jgi:hypothetical protein
VYAAQEDTKPDVRTAALTTKQLLPSAEEKRNAARATSAKCDYSNIVLCSQLIILHACRLSGKDPVVKAARGSLVPTQDRLLERLKRRERILLDILEV